MCRRSKLAEVRQLDAGVMHCLAGIRVREDGQLIIALVRVATLSSQPLVGDPGVAHELAASRLQSAEDVQQDIEASVRVEELFDEDICRGNLDLMQPVGDLGRGASHRESPLPGNLDKRFADDRVAVGVMVTVEMGRQAAGQLAKAHQLRLHFDPDLVWCDLGESIGLGREVSKLVDETRNRVGWQ